MKGKVPEAEWESITAREGVPYHLIEHVAGEEVVLNVGHLHRHRNAVVVGPLLNEGKSEHVKL